ncbi:hypothetical protein WK17_00480 [Burkholderia multivorans]|nr:hypothetical protein WK17_00480 [Burkholderia multivorans]
MCTTAKARIHFTYRRVLESKPRALLRLSVPRYRAFRWVTVSFMRADRPERMRLNAYCQLHVQRSFLLA